MSSPPIRKDVRHADIPAFDDCLNRTDYDDFLENEVNPYSVESDGWDQGRSQQPAGVEHPCLALKKLLSDGTFYYSRDFDLTNRLQVR